MGSIPGMSGDMRLLGGIHRRQAKIYAKLQKGLMRTINAEYAADPHWVMPEATSQKLAEINKFLAETSSGMVRVNDAAIKATGSLTVPQLEAQMRAEFLRAAWSYTPEEWAILDEVRAKRAAQKEQST